MTETNAPHAKTAANYAIEILTAVFESPSMYAPKLVDASNRRTKWFGLQTRRQKTISRTSQESHLTLVRQKQVFGASKENCEEYVLNDDFIKEGALFILHKAIEPGALKIMTKAKTQEEGCKLKFLVCNCYNFISDQIK